MVLSARSLVSLLLASLLLVFAPPSLAASADDGCVALPAGDCESSAPRVLPHGAELLQLDNGARLVAVPAPTDGRVAVDVVVRPRGGVSPDDAVVAWLLGREDGSVSGSARRLRRALLGADVRVEVGAQRVALRTEGRSADLAELLALEASRLADFAPTQPALARASLAVSAQRRRDLADPDLLLLDLVWPGARPGGAPSPQDVASRFASAWSGAALTVVMAGDLVAADALQEATASFSSLPPTQTADAPAGPAADPGLFTGAVGQAQADGVASTRVAIAWPATAPAMGSAEHAADAVVRELLAGRGGPLTRRLTRERRLVTRLWSPDVAGGLVVMAELRGDAHPGAVLAALEGAAAALVAGEGADLVPQIEAARLHLAREALLSLDEPEDWAQAVSQAVSAGAEADAIDRHVEALRQVDLAAVQVAARRVLDPVSARETVLLPVPPPPSEAALPTDAEQP